MSSLPPSLPPHLNRSIDRGSLRVPPQVPPSAVDLRQLPVAAHEGLGAHGLVRVSDGLRRDGRRDGGRERMMSGNAEDKSGEEHHF